MDKRILPLILSALMVLMSVQVYAEELEKQEYLEESVQVDEHTPASDDQDHAGHQQDIEPDGSEHSDPALPELVAGPPLVEPAHTEVTQLRSLSAAQRFEADLQDVAASGGGTVHITESFTLSDTVYLDLTSGNDVRIMIVSDSDAVVGVNGYFRHLAFAGGGALVLELQGVILDGGGVGGGICYTGDHLQLTGGVLQNCLSYQGGALEIHGNAEIDGTIIRNNMARYISGNSMDPQGAGIFVEGSLTICGDTLIEKNGDVNGTRKGGGIYGAPDSTIRINGGSIRHNEALYGGGIAVGDQGQILLQGGSIDNNKAFNGGGVHGAYTYASGVRIEDSQVVIESGGITENAAQNMAGGIYGGTVTIRGGNVDRNTVTGTGGTPGISCGEFYMNGGSVSENTLEVSRTNLYMGVGVHCRSVTMTGGVISGNKSANPNGFAAGGGINCTPREDGDTVTITGGVISGNRAEYGGGIFMFHTSQSKYAQLPVFQMSGGEISGNHAESIGGGLYINPFDAEITGGFIENNTSVRQGGGVFYAGKSLAVADAVIDGNHTTDTENATLGGGVLANFNSETEPGALLISGGTIIQNNQSDYGGGLAIAVKDAQLPHSAEISGGTAIIGNEASIHGGGVYVRDPANLKLSSGTAFTSNAAGEDGGAVWIPDLSGLTVSDESVVFADNSARQGYLITSTDSMDLHDNLIKTKSFTTPFEYVYNNYDVVYTGGVLLSYVTVEFDSGGGSFVASQSVVSGRQIAEPETPAKDGHRFAGWYLEQDFANEWDFNTSVESDMTLYAKWEKKSTGSNGGSGNKDKGGSEQGNSADSESTPITSAEKPKLTQTHRAYVTGYPDRSFHADDYISRAETAVMIYNLLDEADPNPACSLSFADVPENSWYTPAISCLEQFGIMQGYPDGTFHPEDFMTRAELTVVFSDFYDAEHTTHSYSDVNQDYWADTYIANARAKGWVFGYPDGTFRPEQPITRGELVSIVNRVLDRQIHAYDIPEYVRPYTDLDARHWAYADIVEASYSHDYIREDDNYETWLGVKR